MLIILTWTPDFPQLTNGSISHRHNLFNPLVTNGLSHPYHLDGSTFIFTDIRGIFFHIFISFFDEIHKISKIAPDGKPRFAASHLRLFCLPMSHKKNARLIWDKLCITI